VKGLTLALTLLLGAQDPGPRVPWTTSRITGSPEPPPPVRAVRAFPKLTFKKPVHLIPFPDHSRYVLVEEESQLHTFRNDPAVEKADLLINLTKELRTLDLIPGHRGVHSSYALVFDPGFAKNRFCYVMYVIRAPKDKKTLPNGSRISRFRMTESDPPRLDPSSETILIDFLSGGHNGCDLQFGNDGMLYISTGDAEDPSPPDKLRTGQDCSDLLSSILRIDVHKADAGKNYAVPADNPFVGQDGIRPEIWAYGFRNPWRMTFDRSTGRLWVGDVGWERWELVYCVEKGSNYGWSIMEGPTPCIPDAKHGPTPIRPPAHVIPHPQAASITGGFVYRGKKIKGYEGRYFYGDWDTRRVWANPVKGNALGDREEVARTPVRVVAFAEEADGELLVVDHEGGGIHRLEPNEAGGKNADFPRSLSQTGLYASTPAQTPAAGVIPYSINAPMWSDGAKAQRWLGIPNSETINFIDKNQQWPKESVWPKDSVLVKTLTLGERKVETQILHYDGLMWNGYAYAWNEAGTDATLVPAEGGEVDLGGGRKWRVPARAACMTCHNPWPGYALTFNAAQLSRDGQIEKLQKWSILPAKIANAKKLADPLDESAPVEDRARSYLAVNCAHCHRFGGGGSARIDLRYDIPVAETRAPGVAPTLGGFDLASPQIVSGGDPSRSVLYYRMSKLGSGRMPHIGSDVVDEAGLKLIARWIGTIAPSGDVVDSRATDRQTFETLRGGDLKALDRFLAAPTPAMDLLAAMDALPEATQKEAIRRALALPPGLVRDLFERFEPPGQRRERLGTAIKPERILSLKGDAARGGKLFASSAVQCSKCHRLGGTGPELLGADLSKIGGKYNRTQILESLLEPSKFVDPKYQAVIVRKKDGDVLSGIVLSRTEQELVLRDAEKEIRLKAADVQKTVPQSNSMMPDGLLQHLTAQEAADLVAYLESLK
jgi:putative heme-binding domain-containing protein